MALFIKGMGNISPQKTWDASSLPNEVVSPASARFVAIEPDYLQFIDPKNIRRMSRIIKLGVGAATIALRDAKIKIPDAIITGTGYGCLEDTATFLSKMIDNKEEALNPTPFIQSTHNTIGSQIALLLQCQGYNQTYTHGAFSFESALLDAMLQSEDDPKQNILVGAIDEITDTSHSIQKRFGMFRKTANGEGSAFFVTNGEAVDSLARIDFVETLYKPEESHLDDQLKSFGRGADLVIFGIDVGDDSQRLKSRCERFFPKASIAHFKHLSGENPVASSFGVWLAASVLKTQKIPASTALKATNQSVNKILIVNRYFGTHYSLIGLSSC